MRDRINFACHEHANAHILRDMTNAKFIRDKIFELTQAEFAGIAGCSQTRISRIEDPEIDLVFNETEMRNIRNAALDRGIAWDDAWFFDENPTVPPAPDKAGATA